MFLQIRHFIFPSDHGLRFGRILETTLGRHELSLPLLVFFLPAWFRRQFPSFVANLKTNAGNRLVTPFDLHETLKHLLRIREGVEVAEARDRLAGTWQEERTKEKRGKKRLQLRPVVGAEVQRRRR